MRPRAGSNLGARSLRSGADTRRACGSDARPGCVVRTVAAPTVKCRARPSPVSSSSTVWCTHGTSRSQPAGLQPRGRARRGSAVLRGASARAATRQPSGRRPSHFHPPLRSNAWLRSRSVCLPGPSPRLRPAWPVRQRLNHQQLDCGGAGLKAVAGAYNPRWSLGIRRSERRLRKGRPHLVWCRHGPGAGVGLAEHTGRCGVRSRSCLGRRNPGIDLRPLLGQRDVGGSERFVGNANIKHQLERDGQRE